MLLFLLKRLAFAFFACVFIFGGLLVDFCSAQNSEEVKLITYYPAPYGVYKELRADQLTIGSGYREEGVEDGTLLVEDKLGIGTAEPEEALHLVNDSSSAEMLWKEDLGTLKIVPAPDSVSPPLGLDVGGEIYAGWMSIFRNPTAYNDVDIDDYGVLNIGKDSSNFWHIVARKTDPADQLQISYNASAPRAVVTNDGKVGIGTDDPKSMLHLFHKIQDDADAILAASQIITRQAPNGKNTAGTGIRFEMKRAGDPTNYRVGQIYGLANNIQDPSSKNIQGNLVFWTRNDGRGDALGNQNERMRITHDGKVGIGTKNPETALHVVNTDTSKPALVVEGEIQSNHSYFNADFDNGLDGMNDFVAQDGMSDGLWHVTIHGVVKNKSYDGYWVRVNLISGENTVQRKFKVIDHPDGTAPFSVSAIIEVTDGQLRVDNSNLNCFIYGISGYKISR